jgi:prepilin-type processing-associated H-X9-DG protein
VRFYGHFSPVIHIMPKARSRRKHFQKCGRTLGPVSPGSGKRHRNPSSRCPEPVCSRQRNSLFWRWCGQFQIRRNALKGRRCPVILYCFQNNQCADPTSPGIEAAIAVDDQELQIHWQRPARPPPRLECSHWAKRIWKDLSLVLPRVSEGRVSIGCGAGPRSAGRCTSRVPPRNRFNVLFADGALRSTDCPS